MLRHSSSRSHASQSQEDQESVVFSMESDVMEMDNQTTLSQDERELERLEKELAELKQKMGNSGNSQPLLSPSASSPLPFTQPSYSQSLSSVISFDSTTTSICPAIKQTVCFTGVMGADREGNIFAPQKYCFIYNKENKEHAELVEKRVQVARAEWSQKKFAVCVYSHEFISDGFAPTVVSGITSGFDDIPTTSDA